MTGLAILLPIFVTYSLFMFLIHLFTAPFLGVVENVFYQFGWQGNPDLLHAFSQTLIILALIGICFCVGFFGRVFFIKKALLFFDRGFQRIPLVRQFYIAFKEMIYSIFKSPEPSFSEVVLVPYPHDNCYSLGFITRNRIPETSEQQNELISVFVPGAPTPSIGWMFSYRREQLIPTTLTPQQGIKLIVSCGAIYEK